MSEFTTDIMKYNGKAIHFVTMNAATYVHWPDYLIAMGTQGNPTDKMQRQIEQCNTLDVIQFSPGKKAPSIYINCKHLEKLHFTFDKYNSIADEVNEVINAFLNPEAQSLVNTKSDVFVEGFEPAEADDCLNCKTCVEVCPPKPTEESLIINGLHKRIDALCDRVQVLEAYAKGVSVDGIAEGIISAYSLQLTPKIQ